MNLQVNPLADREAVVKPSSWSIVGNCSLKESLPSLQLICVLGIDIGFGCRV